MARYLLIDDNTAFSDNLAEIIADEGNEAVVADSGARALELAAATRFDAVICDMRMPRMSGAEVVRRLRRLDPGLPAIIVSAYSIDDELDSVRHSGLLAILSKPVPVARLLDLLASARRDGLVVLVDDNEDLLESLAEALRQDGFSSVTARSVLEAQALGKVRPFAAVVDLRVAAGPDGEALRRVAERFPESAGHRHHRPRRADAAAAGRRHVPQAVRGERRHRPSRTAPRARAALISSRRRRCARGQTAPLPQLVDGRVDEQLERERRDQAADHRRGDALHQSAPVPADHMIGIRPMNAAHDGHRLGPRALDRAVDDRLVELAPVAHRPCARGLVVARGRGTGA